MKTVIRFINYLSAVVVLGALCPCASIAQVVYPSSGFWVSINGQELETKTLAITRDDAIRNLRVNRRAGDSQNYSKSEIEESAHSLWCQDIKKVIGSRVQQIVQARLGVTVSDDEVRSHFHREAERMDAKGMAQIHETRANALQLAFADILAGVLPDQAWEARLRGIGFPLSAWTRYATTITTEEDRRNLIHAERQVAAAYRQSVPWDGFAELVALRKLEGFIDQELSRDDPAFASYLEQTRASDLRVGNVLRLGVDGAAKLDYLRRQRAQWWERQYASLTVLSSDTELGHSCGISWLDSQTER